MMSIRELTRFQQANYLNALDSASQSYYARNDEKVFPSIRIDGMKKKINSAHSYSLCPFLAEMTNLKMFSVSGKHNHGPR